MARETRQIDHFSVQVDKDIVVFGGYLIYSTSVVYTKTIIQLGVVVENLRRAFKARQISTTASTSVNNC